MNKFCLLNLESKNGLLIESYAIHPQQDQILEHSNLVEFNSGKYTGNVFESHFQEIISRVFSSGFAPNGYVDWLSQQINALPGDTEHKDTLLEWLPKRTT